CSVQPKACNKVFCQTHSVSTNAFQCFSPERTVCSNCHCAFMSIKRHLCSSIKRISLFCCTCCRERTVLIVICLTNLYKTNFFVLKKTERLVQKIRKCNVVRVKNENKFFRC